MLNMFRALLCSSSGARDYNVDNKWNLVDFYSSVITMMHVPTNIKLRPFNLSPKLLDIYLYAACRRSPSPLPFHVINLVNLDTFLFTVAASQFSRHSVTGPRSCIYSSKKKSKLVFWMYEVVFWPDMDRRSMAVLVGTFGYYYEN